MRRRVVVTGLGCVSPVGKSVAESWSNLLEGKSGIEAIK
jgi:3-oxoacyl-[acyl-carrier-protein] synthase II